MKIVYNGAGVDNTSAVKSYLLSTRNPIIHNLFQVGPSRMPKPTGSSSPTDTAPWAYYWTDAEYPIHSTYISATFVPERIKRSSLEYKLGTESSTLTFEIYTRDVQQPLVNTASPRGMPDYQDAAMTLSSAADGIGGWTMVYSLKQAVVSGDLDGMAFTMWRVFEQTEGDADTLGVTAMFKGYISGASSTRSAIQLQVSSLMQTLQIQVPTQTIQPGDRGWQYTPRSNFDYHGTVDNVNTTNFSLVWISAATIPDHVLAEGWMIFVASSTDYRTSGTYPIYNSFYMRRIRDNVTFSNPFGTGAEVGIYMYEAIPWAPHSGDTAYLFAPSTASAVRGFPYVPIPETVA